MGRVPGETESVEHDVMVRETGHIGHANNMAQVTRKPFDRMGSRLAKILLAVGETERFSGSTERRNRRIGR